MAFLLTLLAVFVAFGFLGSYLAGQKHRSPAEGFLLGFALGPIGLLLEVLLPTLTPPKPARAKPRVVRRAVSGWQPPREVLEEQDDEAFRFLTEPGKN
jgi:hypothetical protein